jgi:hypothetical protein
MVTTEPKPKNGTSSILTKPRVLKLRESQKTSVSTSIDHSTSFPNYHSVELLSVLEPTMFK